MASIDEVFRKFGETSESAQLLETELGTLVLAEEARREGWIEEPNPLAAGEALDSINKSTLGRLFDRAEKAGVPIEQTRESLDRALQERNRLMHSFFREHNYRRFSPEGCDLMLADLEEIHKAVFGAYKLILRISGTDLDAMEQIEFPTKHIPI